MANPPDPDFGDPNLYPEKYDQAYEQEPPMMARGEYDAADDGRFEHPGMADEPNTAYMEHPPEFDDQPYEDGPHDAEDMYDMNQPDLPQDEPPYPEDFEPEQERGLPEELYHDEREDLLPDMQNNMADEVEEVSEPALTAETVRGWDSGQTAQYLREKGLDPRHADILEQNEVTGDQLLGMNQKDLYSQRFDFGTLGKRVNTFNTIHQMQRDLGTAPEPPYPVDPIDDEDSLAKKTFKHPREWRDDIPDRLLIQESRDIPPADLIDDLRPTWISPEDNFKKKLLAAGRSKDDVSQLLANYRQGQDRQKLVKDDARGMERTVGAMCSELMDHFNKRRKLRKYRTT